MSAESQLLETAIIISPVERLNLDNHDSLPRHINVVDPFSSDIRQGTKLALCLRETMFRNRFEITGLENEERGNERLQRLGGSVLHNLREDIIGRLDVLHINHNNEPWPDGTDQTWYTGTWQIPTDRNTQINRVHVTQEAPDRTGWKILKTFELKVPVNDFRQDPLYLDSVINPVNKRRKT